MMSTIGADVLLMVLVSAFTGVVLFCDPVPRKHKRLERKRLCSRPVNSSLSETGIRGRCFGMCKGVQTGSGPHLLKSEKICMAPYCAFLVKLASRHRQWCLV